MVWCALEIVLVGGEGIKSLITPTVVMQKNKLIGIFLRILQLKSGIYCLHKLYRFIPKVNGTLTGLILLRDDHCVIVFSVYIYTYNMYTESSERMARVGFLRLLKDYPLSCVILFENNVV